MLSTLQNYISFACSAPTSTIRTRMIENHRLHTDTAKTVVRILLSKAL